MHEVENRSSPSNILFSRRDIAALAVGAGLAGTTGALAATNVRQRAVQIKTPDGTMDAVFVSPAAQKPVPGIIMFPDAMGLRQVKVDMASRLAGEGFAVLVVNQFYRVRPAPVHKPGFTFANPDDRAALMRMIGALTPELVVRDIGAEIAFLDAQPEVDRKAKLGAVGFCMGGSMTIRAAALAPERVGAAVSFHGGGLVTDADDSPHRLIAKTQAAYHIAIAADDDAKEPHAKDVLKKTFTDTGRMASIEVYPETRHGWTVKGHDGDLYNPVQAERAWAAMLDLFRTLPVQQA